MSGCSEANLLDFPKREEKRKGKFIFRLGSPTRTAFQRAGEESTEMVKNCVEWEISDEKSHYKTSSGSSIARKKKCEYILK